MKKRLIGISMCVVLAVSLSFSIVSVTPAKKSNSQLKKEQESIAAQKNKYKKKKADAKAFLNDVDKDLTNVASKIYKTKEKLKETNKQIKSAKGKLKKAEASVNQQNEDMKKRIQFMYENGDSKMIDLLLNSDSIGDFLNKAEYITELSAYDRNMLNKFKKTQIELADAKKSLVDQQTNLKKLEASQKQEQDSLKALENSKKKELAGYDDLIKDTEASEKRISDEIAANQAKIAQAEQAEAKYSGTSNYQSVKKSKGTAGGGWTWPVPGSHMISSPYGYRDDPINKGKGEFHTGLDIAAPGGTPVVAAHSGTVAWANFSSSAGNWIGISHGNGTVSVYMHMQALLVSEGKHVNKGETIGLVGTTGSSTGNHLHFGIQVNGSYVDPSGYVG